MSDISNPWREFIENCISGSNYFRASEYMDLLADLDRGYTAEAEIESLRSRLADSDLQRITEFGELQTALEQLSKCMTDHAITIGERDAKIGEVMYLRSRLAEAEDALRKDAERWRHEWQRECADTDLLLQGMGLCPSEYRSEGGSLLLGRISHKLKQRGGLS